MELRDYLRVFKRRWWIPILLAVAAMLTAGVLGYFSKPTYTAAATVMVKSPSAVVEHMVTFPQAATSNTVAVGVIQKLGLNWSVDRLISRVRVIFAGGNLYKVSVTDPNPEAAAAIANEVAHQAAALYLQVGTQVGSAAADPALAKARDALRVQYVEASTARFKFQFQHPTVRDVTLAAQALELQLEEDAAATAYRSVIDQMNREQIAHYIAFAGFDAQVVDRAAARPDTSGRPVEVLSAGVLALLVGLGLVFLLEYLDNSVREPEAAEEIVGAPVIGVIPRANLQSLRAMKGGA